MITEMAFVAYSVKDVPRAIKFYRDVIGLRPGQTFSDGWAEFDVGPTTFGVGNGEQIGIIPGTAFSAAFEVDDAAAMRERLAAQGVTASDLMDTPCASNVS